MKFHLFVLLLAMGLFLPNQLFSKDYDFDPVNEIKIDVCETSMEEYVKRCEELVSNDPQMEDIAIARYCAIVDVALYYWTVKAEEKLANNPKLLVRFSEMCIKYKKFTEDYAEVASDFLMADFENGTIEYVTMFKNVAKCAKARARIKLIRRLKGFHETGDGHELRKLFGSGPIGGPEGKAARTFKKLHSS